MVGVVELDDLLKSMSPEVQSEEFVFCTVKDNYVDYVHLNPVASFRETEGLTLILPVAAAEQENLPFEGRFKQITLTVHSSLEAVGLTAAVAEKLASYGISANVVAAYYHDHVFVQTEKIEQAMEALNELSN